MSLFGSLPNDKFLSALLVSVIPTRYFLGKPRIGEEMHIAIEKGKMLIIKVLAVGSVNENTGTRDVWFEVNGEVSDCLPQSKCAN